MLLHGWADSKGMNRVRQSFSSVPLSYEFNVASGRFENEMKCGQNVLVGDDFLFLHVDNSSCSLGLNTMYSLASTKMHVQAIKGMKMLCIS